MSRVIETSAAEDKPRNGPPEASRAPEVGSGAGERGAWLRRAHSRLRQADPVMARLIDDRPAFDPRAWMAQLPQMDLYGALLFQVTGQQLSVPATRRTLGRRLHATNVAPGHAACISREAALPLRGAATPRSR